MIARTVVLLLALLLPVMAVAGSFSTTIGGGGSSYVDDTGAASGPISVPQQGAGLDASTQWCSGDDTDFGAADAGTVAAFCNNAGPLGRDAWGRVDDANNKHVFDMPIPFCFGIYTTSASAVGNYLFTDHALQAALFHGTSVTASNRESVSVYPNSALMRTQHELPWPGRWNVVGWSSRYWANETTWAVGQFITYELRQVIAYNNISADVGAVDYQQDKPFTGSTSPVTPVVEATAPFALDPNATAISVKVISDTRNTVGLPRYRGHVCVMLEYEGS